MTRAFSAINRIALLVSSRPTTSSVHYSRIRSHMRGNRLWPPAPSTKDRFQSLNTWGDPLAKDNAAGAAVSGSAPQTWIRIQRLQGATHSGNQSNRRRWRAMTATAPGHPQRSPGPSLRGRSMKLWSSNGCTNVPSTPGNARSPRPSKRLHTAPVIRRAPSARILSIFDAGAVSITNDRAGHARLPCRIRDALSSISCADRPHAQCAVCV